MADKKPPKNVQKLAANAQKSKKLQPKVAKEMRLRGKKQKSAPTHVLTLIAQAFNRKKGK